MKPSARWLQLSGASAAMAYDENSTGLAGGLEAAIDDVWRVGGALSAEDVGGGAKNRVNADGQRFQGGVVVKRDRGQGFAETGAGAVNLAVPDQKDTYARACFKVEAGAEFKGRGAVYRPYGRVGMTYSSDAEKALFEAAFQGVPATAASGFTVNPGLDKATLDTELGLAIIGTKASGRLAWAGRFGDRTKNQTLSLKLAIPF